MATDLGPLDTTATVNLVDRRTEALTPADIQSINGTYTTCEDRTGSWSLAVTGTPTLDHDPLSVIQRNTACVLTLTEIITGTHGNLAAANPIPLSTSYGTAQPFGSPIVYYANALLSSVSFASNFTLTLLFSDSPSIAADSTTAAYSLVTASAATQGVPAPNYSFDLSGISISADFLKVTQTVTGNLALTAGSNVGDVYVITAGAVADTYTAVNTAYLAGTPVTIASTIAASSILALGVNLTSTVVRSIIIARVQNGVRSYQKLAITFNPPT